MHTCMFVVVPTTHRATLRDGLGGFFFVSLSLLHACPTVARRCRSGVVEKFCATELYSVPRHVDFLLLPSGVLHHGAGNK